MRLGSSTLDHSDLANASGSYGWPFALRFRLVIRPAASFHKPEARAKAHPPSLTLRVGIHELFTLVEIVEESQVCPSSGAGLGSPQQVRAIAEYLLDSPCFGR